jgi:hypothetical protein
VAPEKLLVIIIALSDGCCLVALSFCCLLPPFMDPTDPNLVQLPAWQLALQVTAYIAVEKAKDPTTTESSLLCPILTARVQGQLSAGLPAEYIGQDQESVLTFLLQSKVISPTSYQMERKGNFLYHAVGDNRYV